MRSLTRPTVLEGALATYGLLYEGYKEEGEVPMCWVLSCRADRATKQSHKVRDTVPGAMIETPSVQESQQLS